MSDVNFADVLLILLISAVIYAILMLVNRSNKKGLEKPNGSDTGLNEEKQAEE